MLIFGNKKQTSQKYYRTLIFLTMLGHMQKVSHFLAQMKKNAKCNLGHFCPEPFNIINVNLCFGLLSIVLPLPFKIIDRWSLKKKLNSQILSLICRLPMPFCLINSFLLSQHGCKKCGHIFCSGCTSNLLVLPEHGSKKVKVCDQCYRNATR